MDKDKVAKLLREHLRLHPEDAPALKERFIVGYMSTIDASRLPGARQHAAQVWEERTNG